MKSDCDSLSKGQQVLAASAMIPVVGALSRPTTLNALIYTFFVCAYLIPLAFKPTTKDQDEDIDRDRNSALEQSKGRSAIIFALTLVGAGLVSECLVWVSELYATVPNPALLHTQLFAHLILAAFSYAGLAVAWLVLLKYFQFTLREVFFLSFIVALIKQIQLGTFWTICGNLVTDPLLAIVTLASLFVVGGSITALGFLAGGKVVPQDKKMLRSRKWQKYLLSLLLVALLPEMTGFASTVAARGLGLYPPKGPILEAPLI